MKNYRTYAILLTGSLVVSQSLGLTAFASSNTISVNKADTQYIDTLSQLNFISIQPGVSVGLSDVQLGRAETGNNLTYILTYTNTGKSPFKLIDTFSKVITAGGTTVKGDPVPEDKTKLEVAPKERLSVTYYVNVGKTAKLGGVKISLYGWDFSSSDYQKKLGTFTIPATYSASVPRGQSKKITMNNLSITTKPENLQIYKYKSKVYAKIGLSLTNLGAKVLSEPGYKAYLASSGGSEFELVLDDASSAYKVQPGEKKTVTYLTEIPPYMNTANMKLLLTKEDAILKAPLPVASFHLPEAVSPNLSVAAYAVKKLTVGSNTLETQIKSASVTSEGDKAVWDLKFRVKNSGNRAVTFPAYELSVKAKEGYTFPVDSKAFASLTLRPLEEKILQFSVKVPLEVYQGTLQLQLIEPAVEGKIIFPAAYYQIPYSLKQNNTVDSEYTVDNSYGTFAVNLESLQRMPWSSEDLLIAKIRIRNTKDTTVTLPSFTGAMRAGNNDLGSSVQVVAAGSGLSPSSGNSAEYYVIGKLPYTQEIQKLKIELTSVLNDTAETFLSLNAMQDAAAVTSLAAGEAFHIETTGKKAEVKERRTTVYAGTSQNIMYTELEMSSEETRKSEQSRLVAYYKTLDNEYYEAEVNQSELATGPGGKNLVTVWSKLPLSADTSGLVLYIGEGVNDGKLTKPGEQPTAYINTVALALNKQTPTALASLSNSVEMFPYELTITNATGTLTEGESTLDTVLTYNLSQNNSYNMGSYGHKLILEMTDPYGQTYEKTLKIGTELMLGNNLTYSTIFTSNLYKTLTGSKFNLTLYDDFQGERIMLGAQSYYLTRTVKPKAPDAAPTGIKSPEAGQ